MTISDLANSLPSPNEASAWQRAAQQWNAFIERHGAFAEEWLDL